MAKRNVAALFAAAFGASMVDQSRRFFRGFHLQQQAYEGNPGRLKRDQGRIKPHQGEREKARRLRKMKGA